MNNIEEQEKITELLKNYLLDNKITDARYIYHYDKDYDEYISEDIILKLANLEDYDERLEFLSDYLMQYDYFYEFETYTIDNIVAGAIKFLNDNDFFIEKEEIEEILYNIIEFDYIETFLNDKYKVNLIIDFEQQGYNNEFFDSRNLDKCKNNNLYTLLRKQGYTKKDYIKNLVKKENKFLNSVYEEIENLPYEYCNTLVVLKEMTLKEILYNDKFVVNANNMIGLFNSWNGSGSLLEIELEKSFELDRNKDIHYIQVEGTRENKGYSVDEVYGLINECWRNR